MITKEKDEEKKIISEYVKEFTKATKLRKSKNFKSALSTYNQCLKLISSTANKEKTCESHFFIGLCSFKTNDINQSYFHLSECHKLIDAIDKQAIPYYKIKGKFIAEFIHTLLALNKFDECTSFISNNLTQLNDAFKLEEKLIVFLNFIKEFLYPLKKGKKLTAFITQYVSAQNEILYNNENYLNPKVKREYNTLMNLGTKQTVFEKNNLLFYLYEYNVPSSHPLINYIEKNGELFNESNNAQKIKMNMEMFVKNNRIKLDNDFKGKTVVDIINERKKRSDNFNKIWSSITGIFTTVFKSHFNKTQSKNSPILPNNESSNKKKNVQQKIKSIQEIPNKMINYRNSFNLGIGKDK